MQCEKGAGIGGRSRGRGHAGARSSLGQRPRDQEGHRPAARPAAGVNPLPGPTPAPPAAPLCGVGTHSPPRTRPQARMSSVAAMEDRHGGLVTVLDFFPATSGPRGEGPAPVGSPAPRASGRYSRALELRGRGWPRVLLSPASAHQPRLGDIPTL